MMASSLVSFFDEVVAIAFVKLVDGFFALLDQSLQE